MGKKTVVLTISDNTAIINSLEEFYNNERLHIDELNPVVDQLQKENLLKIATYIISKNDEYKDLYHKVNQIPRCYLSAHTLGRSIWIICRDDSISIQFDYSGTLNNRFAPDNIKIYIDNKKRIIIGQSSPKGITDLCRNWEELKPKFDEMILEHAEQLNRKIALERDALDYDYKIAQEFVL